MPISQEQARAELARRELAKRGNQKQQPQQVLPSGPETSFQEISALKGKPLGQQVWQGLEVPAQMSQRGLGHIAEASQNQQPITGNLPRDIAMQAGPIMADTIAEVAPTFINRTSLLTAGALKGAKAIAPAAKAVGGYAAGQLEQLSGARAGSLGRAAEDASLMFGRGKKAVKSLYEAAKNAGMPVRREISEALDHKDVVEKAYQAALDGTINPTEALIARQSLTKMYSRLPKEAYNYYRGIFDDIAKQAFDVADDAYQRALDSESLRNFLPQNKLGGASAIKTALVGMLNSDEAGITKRVIGSLFSPGVQGAGATGLGLAARKVVAPLANNARLGLLAGGAQRAVE